MSIENNINNRKETEFDRAVFSAYETYCAVRIEKTENSGAILAGCRDIVFRIQDVLNVYDPESELSILCRSYIPEVPYPVSSELFAFLKENLFMAERCRGLFDPTIGTGIRYWEKCREQGETPDPDVMKKCLEGTGYEHIHLRQKEQSVQIDVPGIKIHPGASGKGFALDRAAAYLKKCQIRHACLNFGGNICALGSETPQAEGWKIKLRQPGNQDETAEEIILKDQAISTSSWYEHFFTKDGKIFGHLIHPKTGKCTVPKISSVSVITEKAVYGDILSTALYLAEEAERDRILRDLDSENIFVKYIGLKNAAD